MYLELKALDFDSHIVMFDGDIGRHSAHSMNSAQVAGSDDFLGVGSHEWRGHV